MRKIVDRGRILGVKEFVAAGIITFIPGCNELCKNDELSRINSPNEQRSIVIFVRDCGATTSWSWQASLVQGSKRLPNKPGNVLITAGSSKSDQWEVEWKANNRVIFTLPAGIEVRQQIKKVGDVEVAYYVRTE